MGLFTLFKRSAPAAPAAASSALAQRVDEARARARRRLIGAVLLLGIGVIAFPLLFETQPRPIPVDIAIEIPRKEGAPSLVVPPPRPAALAASKAVPAVPLITESKAEAGREIAAPAPAASRAVPKAEPKVDAKVVAKVETQPVAAAATKPDRAEKVAPEVAGRFVVQVGAFADAAVARDARTKVEKLGLRTYTQAVDTDNGLRTRVRLGPFASREEADKAAAKVKAAGLPAVVLTL